MHSYILSVFMALLDSSQRLVCVCVPYPDLSDRMPSVYTFPALTSHNSACNSSSIGHVLRKYGNISGHHSVTLSSVDAEVPVSTYDILLVVFSYALQAYKVCVYTYVCKCVCASYLILNACLPAHAGTLVAPSQSCFVLMFTTRRQVLIIKLREDPGENVCVLVEKLP
jgi:hypothetical protein